MPAGIIVYNDSGTIQIDENYQNLFVVDSGTGGTIPSASGFSTSAFVAGRSTNPEQFVFGESVSASAKWWVIDTLSPSTPDPGYGFRVWTADGKLAFDATQKPVRYHGQFGPALDDTATYSLPAGNTFAIARRRWRARFRLTVEPDGTPPNIWRETRESWALRPTISGTTIAFAWVKYFDDTQYFESNSRPRGVYETYHGGTELLAFDMTHY